MRLQSAFEIAIDSENSLEGIESIIWQSLAAGAGSSNHPWNLGNFSTLARDRPATRTVVLRHVNSQSRLIDFFTDRRSSKIEELSDSDQVSWHFYNTASKIQLRCSGRAYLVTDENETHTAWANVSLRSRAAYLSLATPGQSVGNENPPSTDDRVVDLPQSERGKENFAIVRTEVSSFDWLYLRKDGHLRMSVNYLESPTQRNWLVP